MPSSSSTTPEHEHEQEILHLLVGDQDKAPTALSKAEHDALMLKRSERRLRVEIWCLKTVGFEYAGEKEKENEEEK